ncbi:hypothetical protein SDC9_103554 [bioreactor metagenome]|uniref:Uncharacterized protein n=1 Tax=bioreactor metagenome TaxID=1076179 RepID=A0A645AUE7_9ZZZZ
MHGLTFYHDVRITPFSPSKSSQIPFSKIHSTHKTYSAVNHHYLSVIPIVYFACKQREANFKKGPNLNACILHLFEKATRHMPAPHIIIYHSHLNSLACFINEHIAN